MQLICARSEHNLRPSGLQSHKCLFKTINILDKAYVITSHMHFIFHVQYQVFFQQDHKKEWNDRNMQL
jgi:hypothetical protein